MVDFYAAGSKKGVTNLLMGQSSIDEITDTSFYVSLSSDKSTLSARRYQTAKGDTLYAVIATVSVPSPDSSVRFFDSDWNPLEDDAFFTSPRVCDFAVNPKDKSARQALEAIPFALFRLSFTPDGAIAAELSADYLPDEIKASVTQHITAAPRLYVWNGKRFVCE